MEERNIRDNIVLYKNINVEDVYNMVHEISHMFDIPEDINVSRAMLADVNSECFERMLDCYFEEKEDIDEELKNLQLIRKIAFVKLILHRLIILLNILSLIIKIIEE